MDADVPISTARSDLDICLALRRYSTFFLIVIMRAVFGKDRRNRFIIQDVVIKNFFNFCQCLLVCIGKMFTFAVDDREKYTKG